MHCCMYCPALHIWFKNWCSKNTMLTFTEKKHFLDHLRFWDTAPPLPLPLHCNLAKGNFHAEVKMCRPTSNEMHAASLLSRPVFLWRSFSLPLTHILVPRPWILKCWSWSQLDLSSLDPGFSRFIPTSHLPQGGGGGGEGGWFSSSCSSGKRRQLKVVQKMGLGGGGCCQNNN